MFKILKIRGNSLFPKYQSGDFVIIAKSPLFHKRFKPGEVIVFNQPPYGLMIKQISDILPNGYIVQGTIIESIDSRNFGPVRKEAIIGKVIFHIRK